MKRMIMHSRESAVVIRKMEPSDASMVLSIYEMGLETRMATFETEMPSWNTWDERHLEHSRFVYEENGRILGWIALSPASDREAYKGVAELSVYVDTNETGKSIGSQLMQKAIGSSEENGIWTLFSSVFPENAASIRLHEKHGFRKVGYRERIAKLDGVWRTTVLLERRSEAVGTDA